MTLLKFLAIANSHELYSQIPNFFFSVFLQLLHLDHDYWKAAITWIFLVLMAFVVLCVSVIRPLRCWTLCLMFSVQSSCGVNSNNIILYMCSRLQGWQNLKCYGRSAKILVETFSLKTTLVSSTYPSLCSSSRRLIICLIIALIFGLIINICCKLL